MLARMASHPRTAIVAATSAICALIAAAPAAAETYIFVNPETGKRVQAECDTDPTNLTVEQRQKHCTVGGTSAMLKTYLQLDSIPGEADAKD